LKVNEEKEMRKAKIFISLLFFMIMNLYLNLFAGGLDLRKYIGKDNYVMHLSYNTIFKSDRSFTHYLHFYYNLTYTVMVFSTNPDITVSILDSNDSKTLKEIKKYTIKDNYYFFTTEFTAYKSDKHHVKVKANKSEDFEYYFLATYGVNEVPQNQKDIIDAFDIYSKELFSNDQLKKGNKTYSKKLIGFLYFPSPQTNWRNLYQNTTFMAQAFTMDKNQVLSFYEGRTTDVSKKKPVSVQTDKLGKGMEKFSSKSFIIPINKPKALYTIDLDCTGPSIMISYQLFEEKPELASEITLTKPLPEKTDKMSVNLAGYVSNWIKSPNNYVVVKRINGKDVATFKLDPNIVGTVFEFDLNVPLIPGKNKLIIEAVIDGETKSLEKTVIAESIKKTLLVELTWDTPGTDFDLYVVKPDGEVVCFENQNEGNVLKGWLDIDAKNGYGPERFRIESPGKGRYKIYAHYYNGNVSTNVRAKAITNEFIKEFTGSSKVSNKTNSAADNAGNGPDWILLGEVEIK
jgi:hypothetical protein